VDQVGQGSSQENCKQPQAGVPKMLIIDDDSTYGVLLSAIARKKGFEPHYYPSLLNLGSFACIRDYDIAVIDYFMDSVRGDEIAHYAQMFTMNVPVIIISGLNFGEEERKTWPACVKDFVAKEFGGERIIDAAAEVLKRQEFLKRFGGDGVN
jgi:DNA-binding NtrC family response regulator